MAIYLKDPLYIDWRHLTFSQTHIRIDAGPKGGMEFVSQLPPISELKPEDQILECRGRLVTRSFACGHHHIYSALARGQPPPSKSPRNFLEILQQVWWKLDRLLDREMVKASALATALDLAKNGVTFVIDHHSSPGVVEGSLQTIVEALEQIGISHLLCTELSDRDGVLTAEAGLQETADFLHSGGQGLVGLHASFTVGDRLLQEAVELAGKFGSGIHIHAAEDPIDQEITLKNHNRRVIERLAQAGVLDFKTTILAHCLYLDENERRILAKSKAHVVENVESNLNNQVGHFDSRGLGAKIMLGTDGLHSNMLSSARMAYLVGRQVEGCGMETIYKRFRHVHHYLKENDFKGDGENNLVILNYDSPTEVTPSNFLGHFFYGLESRHVESVIAQGRLIVHHRKLLTADEDDILSYSRLMAQKLWAKL